ncbi:TNF receptor-associated factor 2-like [Montipora capricornis]|uniref:TNF receptor-associated factor 2-like n=1 Tax=Montipora capricornis TaxID=246305 RepID=UPI0035F10B4F
MPGYKIQLIKEKIDPRYVCAFCKLLLKDPLLTACGHFYCESCIDVLFGNPEETPFCVLDGQKLDKKRARPDHNTRDEILSFAVACPFCHEGCQWVGELRHFETHKYREHFALIENVEEAVDPHTEDHHQDEHDRVTSNASNTDPNWMVSLIGNLVDEVHQLSEQVAELRRAVVEQGGSHSQMTRDLANRVKRCEEDVVELHRSVDEQKIESSLDRSEIHKTQVRMKRRVDLMGERRTERRMESIEHTLALRNITLADLEEYVRQQEFSSYYGQLTWKITEFARKRNEAVSGQQVSFYSPCFFTSRYGYKMCARIYLNGDGMGRGSHISVFFVVMRGQYDALLRWPFRQKVTFMLLDQDNVEHVIDAFRPDPSSSSFQRPRRETNIASGCPMFCSIAELNNHAYVRDDTMFLKVIVDTADL